MKKTILFFIADHGFGHISRMTHLLKALNNEGLAIKIISRSTNSFLSDITNIEIFPYFHDAGLIQSDSLNIDFKASQENFNELIRNKYQLFKDVEKVVKDSEISCVLSDTSFMGCWIGKKLQLPVFLIGNFTWSDIYYDLKVIAPDFYHMAERAAEFYQYADYVFKLPLGNDMNPFSSDKLIDVPLIAPPEIEFTEKDWEEKTGLNFNTFRKKILLSFGGHDFENISDRIFTEFENTLFITTRAAPGKKFPNLLRLDAHCGFYQGLIKHADAVITKPGYGIITDCLREKTPIIYTSRGPFAEYEVLKNFLDNYFPSCFISNEELQKGIIEKQLNYHFNKKDFPAVDLRGTETIVGILREKVGL